MTIPSESAPLRALTLILLILAGPACGATGEPEYDFTRPYAVHELPAELEELSGLVVLQGKYVAGVSDETGTFYVVDFVKGNVVRQQPFAPEADYEDVVRVGATLYVLEANGTIYEIPDVRGRAPQPKRYPTGLHDAEGLTYDPRSGGRLLIGATAVDENGGEVGAVYAFDLRTHFLHEAPLFTIPMDAVRTALDDADVEGLDEPFFKPSALALRPGTADLYLTSSKTNALVVVQRDGTVTRAYPLPADLFPEPEGISFLSGGDIVIGNEESRGRPATILRFRPARPF